MTTAQRDLLLALAVFLATVGGHVLSGFLRYYVRGPEAKGLAFFAVFLTFSFLLGKRARYGLLLSLAVCLLAGLLAYIGELIWPGW